MLNRKPSVQLTDYVEVPESTEPVDSEVSPSTPMNLVLKTETWPNDSRGLLHNKSAAVSTREFKVRVATEPYVVSRSCLDTELEQREPVSSSTASIVSGDQCEPLVSIVPDGHGRVKVTRLAATDMWLQVQRNGETLLIGDEIRFGSARLQIIDAVLTLDEVASRGSVLARLFSPESSAENASSTDRPDTAGSAPAVCRICLDNASSEDPLIEPCDCRGSVRHIHISCLVKWITGQLQVRQIEGGGGSYFFRKINCELCKKFYAKEVYKHCLISRPRVPHLVLLESSKNSRNLERSLENSRVHVIPFRKSRIAIGRSKECELYLTDISVSRKHAVIDLSLGDRSATLFDSGSKFGSLIRCGKSVIVGDPNRQCSPSCSPRASLTSDPRPSGGSLAIQVGPSLLSIKITPVNQWVEKFLVPKFLHPKIGQVRLISSRSPNPRVLAREIERRSRVSVPGGEMQGGTGYDDERLNEGPFIRSPSSEELAAQSIGVGRLAQVAQTMLQGPDSPVSTFLGSPFHRREELMEFDVGPGLMEVADVIPTTPVEPLGLPLPSRQD